MAAFAKIAVIEYHIFVGSPQLGCILTCLADNPYAHSSLIKENNAEVNIFWTPCFALERVCLLLCGSQEIWSHMMP